MALLTVTTNSIAIVYEGESVVRSHKAFAALAVGDAIYRRTDGQIDKCDTSTSGKQQCRGICLDQVAAGQACRVLESGWLMGYDFTNINFDGFVYASDTPGRVADGAGTKTVVVGRIEAINEVGNLTKVLHVFWQPLVQW